MMGQLSKPLFIFSSIFLLLASAASADHGYPHDTIDSNDAIDFDSSYSIEDSLYNSTDDIRNLHHQLKQKKHKMPADQIQPPAPRMMPPQAPPTPRSNLAPTAVRQQLVCPADTTLVDNQCVRAEVIPGSPICPPGQVMVNGQCAMFSRGERFCPDGFRVSANRCVATEVVPAELMCEEGELDAAGGLCHVAGRGRMQCPKGFVMGQDGQCSQAMPATKSCPPGSKMPLMKAGQLLHKEAHFCVQESKAAPNPVCPPGSEMHMDGKKCLSMIPNRPKCPKGYMASMDKSMCVKKVKKVLGTCPPGFTEFSKHKAVCERVNTIPPQMNCSPGSILNPATGQCEMEIPGAGACADGYVPSRMSPGMCEHPIEMEAVCPPGTMAVGFGPGIRCQSSVEHPLIECCPPEFDLIYGQCERRRIFPMARSTCEGVCETVTTAAPDFYCPDGFTQFGMQCMQRDAPMCEQPRPRSVPTECEAYVSVSSLRTVRGLEEDQVPAHCAPYVIESPCTPPERVPAQVSCPNGGMLEGNSCVLREAIVTPPFCKVGTLDPTIGQCVQMSRVPMKTECPEGTTRIGQRCMSYEEHLPMFNCPASSSPGPNGECLVRVPLSQPTSNIVRMPPIPSCSMGTLQGPMCFHVERIPRHYGCPGNSVPSSNHLKQLMAMMGPGEMGKFCLEVAEFVMTAPFKKMSKPKYYCPDGSVALGKHCNSHHKLPPMSTCPPGTTMVGELCMRYMPPSMGGGHVRTSVPAPFCPHGTTVDGMNCVVTREAPAQIMCPPGFQLQQNNFGDRECMRMFPSGMSCPPGTRQTADGCIRSITIPPTVATFAANDCVEEHGDCVVETVTTTRCVDC